MSQRLTGLQRRHLPRHWPALLKTLANIVAIVKVKTLAQKLANVKAKALVDLLANALAVIQVETHCLRWRQRC